MTDEVAYVQLSGASSRATLGLYAGMQPQELQLLVCAALNHREGVCAGFQVAQEAPNVRSGRKKRHSTPIQRIIPLSVACKAPELLGGRASALFAASTPSQSALEPEKQVKQGPTDVNKLNKLLQALEREQKLSSFEAAVLRHLCEQERAQVLAEMSGKASVDEKKRFLLELLRPEASTTAQKELQTPKRREKQQQGEDALHAELVAKKVVAIAHRVFSPQVQMQVLALAEEIRESWSLTGKTNVGTRFADTVELLTLVQRLLDKHVLPEEHGAHLLELVLGENQVLWSALQSYKNDGGSLSDLEMTAKRLAALGIDPPKPIASKKKGKSPKKLAKLGRLQAVKKRVKSAAAATPSAVSVVRSLHAQHMLTSLELDIVQALVAQDDTQVLQILLDFEQSDHLEVQALRDALVGIVEEITMELGDEEKAAAAFARGVDDAVREENPFVDSDDDSDSLGWQRHVTFLVGQWQAQHHLSPADANTLRKMVAQRHNLLESAYEVFAGDGDASELLDTLQRVAKLQRQIEQSQAGQNVLNGEPASNLSLVDVVREMQQRGVIQAGDAGGLLVLFHNGNEALQAANEAFLADGDVRELEETLLLVVKHARFGRDTAESEPVDEGQVVSRLLAEFARGGLLELWQIHILMSLLKSHDPRLLAAVDVYNEDQNAQELIETLEILVEFVAWERHRRAMVHDWIAPLARSGKLPRGGAECLAQLVKARDDRVVAALVVFLSDNNKEEFVDTLVRIACLEAMKLKNVEADSKKDESKEGHLVLALLEDLEDKGIMSSEDRGQIEELVCTGEPRILAAMDVLAATHDEEDFVDTARRILTKPRGQDNEATPSSEGAANSPKPAAQDYKAIPDEAAADSPNPVVQDYKATSDEAAKDPESDLQFPATANVDDPEESDVLKEKSGELAEPEALQDHKENDESEQTEEQKEADAKNVDNIEVKGAEEEIADEKDGSEEEKGVVVEDEVDSKQTDDQKQDEQKK